MSQKSLLVTLAIAASLATSTIAAPKIELPPEPAVLKPGPGAELVAGQCLICHSADYLSTAPTLPRTYWKTAVEKMQKKFGAPLTDAQIEPLVDYLVRSYGTEKPPQGGPAAPGSTPQGSSDDVQKGSVKPGGK